MLATYCCPVVSNYNFFLTLKSSTKIVVVRFVAELRIIVHRPISAAKILNIKRLKFLIFVQVNLDLL